MLTVSELQCLTLVNDHKLMQQLHNKSTLFPHHHDRQRQCFTHKAENFEKDREQWMSKTEKDAQMVSFREKCSEKR